MPPDQQHLAVLDDDRAGARPGVDEPVLGVRLVLFVPDRDMSASRPKM